MRLPSKISMSYQHNSTAIKGIFKNLRLKGFTIEERKSSIKIVPPKCITGIAYFTHGTESAYHSIRRDFARMYNVDVTCKSDLESDPLYVEHLNTKA
jgi:hypothetical protein